MEELLGQSISLSLEVFLAKESKSNNILRVILNAAHPRRWRR